MPSRRRSRRSRPPSSRPAAKPPQRRWSTGSSTSSCESRSRWTTCCARAGGRNGSGEGGGFLEESWIGLALQALGRTLAEIGPIRATLNAVVRRQRGKRRGSVVLFLERRQRVGG